MINAGLLKVARDASGLTQSELAMRSGLPQADISRWERGLRTPNASHVLRLAETLDVPVGLLTDPGRVLQPVYRSARVTSQRVKRKIDARLELARYATTRLLADVEIEAPFSFPTADEPAPADPEAAASALRRVWRVPPGPLHHLISHVEAAGAIVAPVDFATDSVLAAYASHAGNARWCFVNSRAVDAARLRFSVAHEIGHAVLHWDRFDAPIGKDAEREAHRFAAALLMPRDEMLASLADTRMTRQELVMLGERWQVSVQAIIMRAADIGLLSEHQKGRLFRSLNAAGVLRRSLVPVELERPSVLADALRAHREVNGYSQTELAELAGLPLHRLGDLLPDLFPSSSGPGRPRLHVVPRA